MSSESDSPRANGQLVLQFCKRGEASATLTVLRPDGSATSASMGAPDGFGPLHDLAHYVVEYHLGLAEGFLGLIAGGATPHELEFSILARIAPDAVRSEGIAGLLALEILNNRRLPLGDFNDVVADKCGAARPGYKPPDLTPSLLAFMRADLEALRRQWESLGPGSMLELSFVPPRPDRSGPPPS